MYNSALQMVADGKYEEALEMLLNTIGLQYLNVRLTISHISQIVLRFFN